MIVELDMICDAKNLSPDQKIVVESLLGRRISEHETVSIQAFEPQAGSAEHRQEIAAKLKRYFAEVDAHRQPVSPAEADEIIDEAMRSSRPGFRSRV